MLTHPGNHLGDAWYFVEGDVVHAYYLTCPDRCERHAVWDIGHATSRDLVGWEIHPLALERGAPGEWDHDCLATGSVIRRDGRYWMAYTSHLEGTTGLAVSDDLFRWEKCAGNPTTDLDPRHYEPVGSGVRSMKHWRDPSLLEHAGRVWQFVCASARTGPSAARGTVGVAVTDDLRHWTVLPPLRCEAVASELECPTVIPRDGRYYLVFSTHPHFWTEEAVTRYFDGDRPASSTFCMVADALEGPYTFRGDNRIVAADREEQPYAGQIVATAGGDFLVGTVWNDTQDYLCDPIPAEFTPRGIR